MHEGVRRMGCRRLLIIAERSGGVVVQRYVVIVVAVVAIVAYELRGLLVGGLSLEVAALQCFGR